MGYLTKGPRFDLNFHENQLTRGYIWWIYNWFCLLIFFLSMHVPTTCEKRTKFDAIRHLWYCVPSTTRKFKWRFFFFGWDYVSTMYLLSSTVLTHLNRISTQNFNKDLDQFLIVMFIVFLIIIIFFYEFSFLYIVWKSCRIISFGSIILIGWLVMQAYMHGL